MNQQRRKNIKNILYEIIDLKDQLQIIINEEQEVFDNMPESIQEGSKGEKSSGFISNMEDALSSMEDAEEMLNECL